MKLFSGMATVATLAMIAGIATAAEPSRFVQTGENAKAVMDENTINIATAEAIGQACLDEATKEGVKVSVVIMDQFGEPVWFSRMDGQKKVNVDTAFMKAKTALNARAPSKSIMNAVARGQATELREFLFGNFWNSGALPIVVNNQMIGVIGVGGSAPKLPVWSDEICAWRALNRVIGPQPPLLPDVQRNAAAGGAGPRGNGAPNQ